METIFDHNLNDDERRSFWADFPQDEYMENLTQESAYLDIFSLYLMRRDDKKSDEYLSKIKQKELLALAKEIAYTDLIDS